jgi:predicted outer membrane protein
MKLALAFALAGAASLALAADQAPEAHKFAAEPLCKNGEVVGVQIYTNRPGAFVLTWDRSACATKDS